MNGSINNMNIPNREGFLKGCEEFEKHEKRDAMYKVATFLVSHFWCNPSDMADGLGVLLLTWNQAFYRYGIFDFDRLEKCIADNFEKINNFRNRDISSLSNSDEDDIKDLFNKLLDALQINAMRFSDKNKKKYTKEQFVDLLSRWNIKYDNDNLRTIYESIKDNQKVKGAIEFLPADTKSSKKDYIQILISKLGERERTTLSKGTRLIMKSPVAVAKTLHLLASNFFPIWDDKIARAYKCYYKENPAEKYVSFCSEIKAFADKVKNYISRSDKTLIKFIDEYNYTKCTLRLK
jgi:hypothetical protein